MLNIKFNTEHWLALVIGASYHVARRARPHRTEPSEGGVNAQNRFFCNWHLPL
jgi:hypothetical protein